MFLVDILNKQVNRKVALSHAIPFCDSFLFSFFLGHLRRSPPLSFVFLSFLSQGGQGKKGSVTLVSFQTVSWFDRDCLFGLESGRPDFDSRFQCRSFTRLSHTNDLNIDTPVATLPGAWHDRVGTGSGLPGVSVL